MNISLLAIVGLIWLHIIFDVVLQPDIIAEHKHENNLYLLTHVAIYSSPFLIFGFVYALVNGILHFATDWVGTRIASPLWDQGRYHLYFIARIIDHAIHFSCLFITYYFLVATA
jgi:hypothetical protein